MEQSDSTAKSLTPAEFLTPQRLASLSANQQKYAAAILNDVLRVRKTVDMAQGDWTPQQVAATLAALPTMVDQPHLYFVAVVPVLSAYFKAQKLSNLKALDAALKAARPDLVEKHAAAADEQEAYEGVVALVEQWVQAMTDQPDVANLSAADQQNFMTIVHTTAELMITGKGKQPKDWDVQTLSEIMFGPFTHLLDEKDRVPALFNLVPFALTTLFAYLADQQQLPAATALQDWVSEHHTALVTMYDPKLESFFEDLTTAMQAQNIDADDAKAVDAFTQDYLRAHPTTSRELFTTDRQLTHKKHIKQIKYSQKKRRKHRRR
ncbi:hypothetical protein [Levilactobacillus mulengensis]|uniref:hypothetical protein n=1 Tax=Levilactobacillus mulengensis TaxID=2486025 RepID=UPI000F7B0E6A|nr:hypothetical protein [Levilactobacillus mulengensis]